MAIFQNTPAPLPGQYGHDDEGVLHLNVPEQGLVPVPQQFAPMDLQNSPAGSSGGGSMPAPMPSNAPAMQPAPAPMKNDLGMAIVDGAPGGNAPAAPFNAPANTNAMPAPAPMMPQIQSIKETKTESKKIRPEDKAAMDKTNEALANAIHADANAQAAKSNAEATLLDSHTLELQQQNQKMQEAEAQRQKAISERMSDVDKEVAKQSEMSVDPNYFGKLDTPGKFATILGMLISGVGAGGSGKESAALDIFNKTVDRDIEAQKANIAKQGAVVAAKRGGYQDFLAATQDERAAEALEHNRQSEIFKGRLEQVVAKTNDPIVKANAEKQIAAINAGQAEKVAIAQTVATEQGSKKAVSLGQGSSTGVNGRIPQDLANKQLAQREALADLARLKQMLKDPKVTKHMGPVRGSFNEGELQKGSKFAISPEAIKYNTLAKGIVGKATRAIGGGNPSEGEREFAKQLSPNGLGQEPDLAEAQIEQAMENLLRAQKNTDEIANAYRTGKLVSGDSEPKP